MTGVANPPGQALPRWDLTPFYPAPESAEFERDFEAAAAEVDRLSELFASEGIGDGEGGGDPAATAGRVLDALNDAIDRIHLVTAYLYARISVDSGDDAAQARLSQLRRLQAELAKLGVRFTAWVGGQDVDALLRGSPIAGEHAHVLRREHEAARHLMPRAEEELAADLRLSGAGAWGKLHGDVTSRITVPFERDGERRELPISELRALGFDADRDVRRRAYEAELAAWDRAGVPLAGALNSIKWEVLTLCERRGWASPLDEALFENGIDRATLDAMLGAVSAAAPGVRRYLKAKAALIGVPALAWYDLFAPVAGADGRAWAFGDARDFILEQFGSYSPRLRDRAARSFAERWIDAEPRPGKVDGGFCLRIRGDESRILVNYAPSYSGLATIAHELGHGYHNACLAEVPALRKQTPMTLAETASTFCETIVREAALAAAAPGERIEILEGSLQDSAQVVLDAIARMRFEEQVFERRAERELSCSELCEAMAEAQRELYGDGLAPDLLHPYLWAVKPHFYSADRSFYNFPYTFGLLFGLGLYARYREDAERFRAGYDDLLASTGSDDVDALASRFGIDVRDQAFWRASLDVVLADVERFEELAGGTVGHPR